MKKIRKKKIIIPLTLILIILSIFASYALYENYRYHKTINTIIQNPNVEKIEEGFLVSFDIENSFWNGGAIVVLSDKEDRSNLEIRKSIAINDGTNQVLLRSKLEDVKNLRLFILITPKYFYYKSDENTPRCEGIAIEFLPKGPFGIIPNMNICHTRGAPTIISTFKIEK